MESPNLEFEYGDTDTLVAELSGTHFDNSVFEKVGLGSHIWPTSSSDSSISLKMLIHPIKMNVQIKQPWRAKLGCPSFFYFLLKPFLQMTEQVLHPTSLVLPTSVMTVVNQFRSGPGRQ